MTCALVHVWGGVCHSLVKACVASRAGALGAVMLGRRAARGSL